LLSEIRDFNAAGQADIEFLVVDDGSLPEESGKMSALVSGLGLPDKVSFSRRDKNCGKGAALRFGFEKGLSTDRDYMGFIDADGSVPLPELARALRELHCGSGKGFAAITGARVKMLGYDVNRNPLRHYAGRVFATFVSLVSGAGIYDSQCGLKIFRRDALARHLNAPTDCRWVWDTQLLFSMLAAGEKILEMPVSWREVPGSKVSLIKDPLVMALHLAQFQMKLRKLNGY